MSVAIAPTDGAPYPLSPSPKPLYPLTNSCQWNSSSPSHYYAYSFPPWLNAQSAVESVLHLLQDPDPQTSVQHHSLTQDHSNHLEALKDSHSLHLQPQAHLVHLDQWTLEAEEADLHHLHQVLDFKEDLQTADQDLDLLGSQAAVAPHLNIYQVKNKLKED